MTPHPTPAASTTVALQQRGWKQPLFEDPLTQVRWRLDGKVAGFWNYSGRLPHLAFPIMHCREKAKKLTSYPEFPGPFPFQFLCNWYEPTRTVSPSTSKRYHLGWHLKTLLGATCRMEHRNQENRIPQSTAGPLQHALCGAALEDDLETTAILKYGRRDL